MVQNSCYGLFKGFLSLLKCHFFQNGQINSQFAMIIFQIGILLIKNNDKGDEKLKKLCKERV